jgi:hypothetical protein
MICIYKFNVPWHLQKPLRSTIVPLALRFSWLLPE